MAPHNILAEVRRTPFEPFRMVLANGAVYDIRHAAQCMDTPKSVLVGAAAHDPDGLVDYTLNVNPYNVLRIERGDS